MEFPVDCNLLTLSIISFGFINAKEVPGSVTEVHGARTEVYRAKPGATGSRAHGRLRPWSFSTSTNGLLETTR